MKSPLLAIVLTLVVLGLIGFAFIGFMAGYGSPTTSIKDMVGDGMVFLSTLMLGILCLQIGIAWVIVSQVNKLKNYLDGKADHLNTIDDKVTKIKNNLDYLL